MTAMTAMTFLLWNEAKVEHVGRHRRLYSRPKKSDAAKHIDKHSSGHIRACR